MRFSSGITLNLRSKNHTTYFSFLRNNKLTEINNNLSLELPPELETVRKQIEATIKPYIKIDTIVNDDLTLWQSKFGGNPYFPQHLSYPTSPNGNYLSLLAQINFAEVPPLEDFPRQGILQFYIDANDSNSVYGVNFDNLTAQTSFRVVYFPDVDTDAKNLISNFDFLSEIVDFPFSSCFSLNFTPSSAPISWQDYRFYSLITNPSHGIDEDEINYLIDEYGYIFSREEHKLGGYPYFTQEDPRTYMSNQSEPYELLFQIVSSHDAMIYWGDMGVGNFFIKKSNLQKLDFTDVIYTYDCC